MGSAAELVPRVAGKVDEAALLRRLTNILAFGWAVFESHWQSHAVMAFALVKGRDREVVTYHCTTDAFAVPRAIRARYRQTRLPFGRK